MDKKLGISPGIVRILLEIGIMCAQRLRHDQAIAIGRALARFRPELEQPRALVAVAHFARADGEQDAKRELETMLKDFPDSQLAKAFLGAVCKQAGQPRGDALLKQVIEDGSDEWAVQFACGALGYAYRSPPGTKRRAPVARAIPG